MPVSIDSPTLSNIHRGEENLLLLLRLEAQLKFSNLGEMNEKWKWSFKSPDFTKTPYFARILRKASHPPVGPSGILVVWPKYKKKIFPCVLSNIRFFSTVNTLSLFLRHTLFKWRICPKHKNRNLSLNLPGVGLDG